MIFQKWAYMYVRMICGKRFERIKNLGRWMAGWMTCDFTSFSTVFRSYQDDERLIMKDCVQWNHVNG